MGVGGSNFKLAEVPPIPPKNIHGSSSSRLNWLLNSTPHEYLLGKQGSEFLKFF